MIPRERTMGLKWRRGRGGEKIHLHAAIVHLPNPFTEWMGALIGAVGYILIATCQLKAHISPGPPQEEFTLIR